MPRPLRPCRGNRRHLTRNPSGYCSECQQQRNAQERAKPWKAVYHSAKWEKVKAYVVARDPVCQWCKRAPSQTADHIVPLAQSWPNVDPYDPDGLVGSCHRCNRERAARQAWH